MIAELGVKRYLECSFLPQSVNAFISLGAVHFSPGLNIGSKCSLANMLLQASSPTKCYGD